MSKYTYCLLTALSGTETELYTGNSSYFTRTIPVCQKDSERHHPALANEDGQRLAPKRRYWWGTGTAEERLAPI